jgi:hypothetical protein
MAISKWQIFFVQSCQQVRPVPKDKFVVVAHVDTSWCYGFFINSRLNQFILDNPRLLPCEVAISAKSHAFLAHDSFIECKDAYVFPTKDLNNSRGMLDQQTIENVINAVTVCPALKQIHKKIILGQY